MAGRKDLMQGEASVGSQPEDMHGERTSWPALSPLGGGQKLNEKVSQTKLLNGVNQGMFTGALEVDI